MIGTNESRIAIILNINIAQTRLNINVCYEPKPGSVNIKIYYQYQDLTPIYDLEDCLNRGIRNHIIDKKHTITVCFS